MPIIWCCLLQDTSLWELQLLQHQLSLNVKNHLNCVDMNYGRSVRLICVNPAPIHAPSRPHAFAA